MDRRGEWTDACVLGAVRVGRRGGVSVDGDGSDGGARRLHALSSAVGGRREGVARGRLGDGRRPDGVRARSSDRLGTVRRRARTTRTTPARPTRRQLPPAETRRHSVRHTASPSTPSLNSQLHRRRLPWGRVVHGLGSVLFL